MKPGKPKVELDFLMAPKAGAESEPEEEEVEEGEGGDVNALIAELHSKLDQLQGVVGSF